MLPDRLSTTFTAPADPTRRAILARLALGEASVTGLAAPTQHLVKEKELTRLRDQLSAERRELPWVKIEKNYVFGGPNGKETLADLFAGRSQLIVSHFMFGPRWKEGCVGCSFLADHIDGALVYLEPHDVTYVAVSRAPLPEIEAFKKFTVKETSR